MSITDKTKENPADEQGGAKKDNVSITLWIPREVAAELDKRSNNIDRSRSWMASLLLKQAFGMQSLGGDK